jgi:hypothetical protein
MVISAFSCRFAGFLHIYAGTAPAHGGSVHRAAPDCTRAVPPPNPAGMTLNWPRFSHGGTGLVLTFHYGSGCWK